MSYKFDLEPIQLNNLELIKIKKLTNFLHEYNKLYKTRADFLAFIKPEAYKQLETKEKEIMEEERGFLKEVISKSK